MKKYKVKIMFIIIFLASIMFFMSNEVCAVFTADHAEDELSSGEALVEVVSNDRQTTLRGEQKFKEKDEVLRLDGRTYTKGDNIIIHVYFERKGLKENKGEIKWDYHDSNVALELLSVKYDTSGNNSVEFFVSVSLKESGSSDFYIMQFHDGEKKLELKVEIPNIEKTNEEKFLDKLKVAYQDINLFNGSAGVDVAMFVQSDFAYNDSKQLKEMSLEQLENALRKINMLRGDESKEPYKGGIQALETYIQLKKNDITEEEAKKQLNDAKQEVQQTIKGYTRIISKLDSDNRKNDANFVDVFKNINAYIPNDTITIQDAKKVTDKASIILTVMTNVGMIIAVVMCAIVGVKYMLGSVDEKAEYKKDMIPYLIGAFLLFGITAVVKVLQQVGESINNI